MLLEKNFKKIIKKILGTSKKMFLKFIIKG